MDYTRGKANKKYRGNVLSYKYFGGYTRGKPKKNYDGNEWGWPSKMMFFVVVMMLFEAYHYIFVYMDYMD